MKAIAKTQSILKNKIRLHTIDVDWNSIKGVVEFLSEHFDIELTSKNPDFIIHSCFGREIIKFKGVRIAWIGENIRPDFNISDYAIAFDHMDFGDRYLRVPLYRWYMKDYEMLFDSSRRIRDLDSFGELGKKTKFCTAVISNSNRGASFEKFYRLLSKYKRIDSGGGWRNNVGGPVNNKLNFIQTGKFHIAFENSSFSGYVTEKILHAFVAKTIPIYWGAPDVVKDFNSKAFINFHDFSSVEEVVDQIIELDKDDKAYIKMLKEPPFPDGVEPDFLRKEVVLNFFYTIFKQPRDVAYRRNRYNWGSHYEIELKRAFFNPPGQLANLIRRWILRKVMSR